MQTNLSFETLTHRPLISFSLPIKAVIIPRLRVVRVLIEERKMQFWIRFEIEFDQLDNRQTTAELSDAQFRAEANRDPSRVHTLQETVTALQTQVDAAERLRSGAVGAQDRLRSLDAQLDEIVARTVELSATADDIGAVDAIGADLDRVRMGMEAVRQGLEEVSRIDRGTTATT